MDREQNIQMRTAFGQSENIGVYAAASVINELAAAGTPPFRISVQLFLPPDTPKAHGYGIEKKIRHVCRKQNILLDQVQTDMQAGVCQCMAAAAGMAAPPAKGDWKERKMHSGQDIVLVKYAGMEGMLRIAEEREEGLKKRFAPVFFAQIRQFEEEIFALKEIDIAKAGGACAIRQIGGGGIFASLWRLSKEAGTGVEADLKKISVRQETIEVCEHFRLNPYQLTSSGSLLVAADDGEALADALKGEGAEASVIGRLTDSNDKIIRNGEEVRYIGRPAPDEINKIFMEEPR